MRKSRWNYKRLLKTAWCFETPGAATAATLPRGEPGVKMNNCVSVKFFFLAELRDFFEANFYFR